MQLEFLDRIWGTATGYVQFVQKIRDAQGDRTGEPKETKAFMWPSERDRITRYLSLRTEEDLYFAVPLYKTPVRQQLQIKLISAVYVDNDGVPVENYAVHPSYSVFSSPGHRHDYWVLNEPADPTRALRIGLDISTIHRHDGEFHEDMAADHKFCGTDPGGWDSTQILRVPETLNTKVEVKALNEGESWRIHAEDYGFTYTLEELEAAFPQTDAVFVGALPDDVLPAEIPDHVQLLGTLSGRADLIDLFSNEPTGRGDKNGWDERLFAFENELFRLGYSAPEVYSLSSHAACNKFKRGVRNERGGFDPRPNWPLDLWRDVLKAQLVHNNRVDSWTSPTYDSANSIVPGDFPDIKQVYQSEKQEFLIDLLTPEEHDIFNNAHTFVDEFVEWASSKTDAATVYHEASAFTILSVVFGEFGHAMPKFGKLRLNLWFLVLGKTTRARKSTSRGLMIKFLDGISGGDFEYDEGSDFTGEGLLERLGEKPKRSSIVHRDEVQGLFKEVKSKSYMTGLSDTLTELYDGWVRGSLRKGQGRVEKQETNFILFLMGIVSKVTSVLTLEDFQSGFLARFIHVIGEAPERTKESEWLDQADPFQIAAGDPVYLRMIHHMQKIRAYWVNLAPNRETIAIRFTDEAWARWNEANWDLQESVRSHERAEILEAAVDRMGKSAIKAATLLAMSRSQHSVGMEDTIVAIGYMTRWAEDMVRSAEMVTESFFKKDVNTLHEIILKKGSISWGEAFTKMDKQPNEFKTIVEALVISELARIRVDEKTHSRWLEAV